VSNNDNCLTYLKKHNLSIYAATLQKSILYTKANFKNSSAIVMGSEANGLSPFWYKNATPIKIPMLGRVDSLNVSVAAAVLIYEAIRQRKA
jgi:TrmH family RNA methyltransferase